MIAASIYVSSSKEQVFALALWKDGQKKRFEDLAQVTNAPYCYCYH